jgi:hypothetical protein
VSVLLGEAHSSRSRGLRVYWYCCKILAFWFGDLKGLLERFACTSTISRLGGVDDLYDSVLLAVQAQR